MPDYGPLYQAAGTQYGIDPLLLQAIAGKESDQDPDAVGPMITRGPAAGQRALGMMQFIPQTAAQYDVTYPMSPVQSVFGASNYMDTLLKRHDGNLRAALAEYSGNAGNQTAPYVNDVMGRYTALQRAWAPPPMTPTSSAPATDTDPDSPTLGQATGKNFTTPPQAPTFGTTAKGNPGEPSPSVPTTSASNAPPAAISMAAPGLEPPSAGGPKGQRTSAPAPDYLENAPAPQAKPAPAPAAPGAPAAAAAGPDYLEEAPQQLDADGQPIKPMDTGQYLTAPTSPGAKAVGAQPSGTPIAEGKVPGPDFQATIALATDQAQKARIAGHALFPNEPPDQAADRIIIGPGGRMAAVPDSGQPYFIEPPPVFNPQTGWTRQSADQGPSLAQLAVSGSRAISDNANQPPGPWQAVGSGYVSPYSRAAPLGPGATATNVPLAMGGAIPGTVQNYLTAAPAAIGTPLVGGILTAGASQLAQSGRQYLANRFDPDYAAAPSALPTPGSIRNALIAGTGVTGLRVGGALLAPEVAAYSAKGEPGAPSTALKSGVGSEVPLQFPLGEAGGARAPWENPLIRPSETPTPTGPAERLPIAGSSAASGSPGEPGVQLNPAGEAAAASGPYAPSRAEEVAAIPTAVPVSRRPILTQAQAANRADELIRYFAAQGPTQADTRTLVPGSSGTLAGVTGNAGIASLERLVRNIPEAANRFAGADTANKEAERTFTANLVGSPDDVARAEAQRDAATSAAREAAFANKTATDPSQQVAAIDQVLQGPAGKRPAIALPLRQIRGLFYTVNPETGAQELETDPEMLYGVRQAITDALGPLSRGTDRDARAAAAQLQPILNGLDATIEAGAPGFKDYLAQFHDLSQPITSMRFLQSRNLTDANGYPLLRPVDTLLKDIQKQRTLQPGVRPADALSDDQISQLENLRDDLRRQANLGKGKALGSNTAQNLVGNQTLNMLTRPAAQEVGKAVATTFGGLPGYLATGAAENVLSGAVQRRQGWVLDALIDRLLNKDNLGVRALTPPGAAAP